MNDRIEQLFHRLPKYRKKFTETSLNSMEWGNERKKTEKIWPEKEKFYHPNKVEIKWKVLWF